MRKISQEERTKLVDRFDSAKPVSAYLPMVFPSGFKLTKLIVNCSSCKQDISPSHFRCEIVALLPKVYRVEGIGICINCRCAGNYLFRLRDDSPFVIEKINDKGQWTQYASHPISRFRRIQRSVSKYLHGFWHT